MRHHRVTDGALSSGIGLREETIASREGSAQGLTLSKIAAAACRLIIPSEEGSVGYPPEVEVVLVAIEKVVVATPDLLCAIDALHECGCGWSPSSAGAK